MSRILISLFVVLLALLFVCVNTEHTEKISIPLENVERVDMEKLSALLVQFQAQAKYQNRVNSPIRVMSTARAVTSETASIQIIQGLMKSLGISGDFKCSPNLSVVMQNFTSVAHSVQRKDYPVAVESLTAALKQLSIAIEDCKEDKLTKALSSYVKLLGYGEIKVVDKKVFITVAGNNIFHQLEKAAAHFENGEYSAFGSGIGALISAVDDLSKCDSPTCEVIAGLLKSFGISLDDMSKCKGDIAASIIAFDAAVYRFHQKEYPQAIRALEDAMHLFAKAAGECQLPQLAQLIEDEASRLGLSNVTIIGDTVKIIVDGADVYQTIESFAVAWKKGDRYSAGIAIGRLVLALQKLSCQSPICDVVNGILKAMKIVVQDMGKCKSELESAYHSFQSGIDQFKAKQYKASLGSITKALHQVADGVDVCQLNAIADLIRKEAGKFGFGDVTVIGEAVKILVGGADVYNAIYGAVNNWQHGDFDAFGRDVGSLIKLLGKCDSPACFIIQGILDALELAAEDMSACKSDIELAYKNFASGVTSFKAKEYPTSIKHFTNGLNDIAKAARECKLTAFAQLIDSESQKLGGGSIQWLDSAIRIVVHGADVYENLFDAVQNFESGNFAGFGRDMGNLVKTLRSMSCTSPVCQVLEGILEALKIVAQDFGPCKAEISAAETNIMDAVVLFKQKRFTEATKSLSEALERFSLAVDKCGIPKLGIVLANLAKQLNFKRVSIIDDAIKILVAGTDIYHDIFAAIGAWESKNYRGFGRALVGAINKIEEMRGKSGCDAPICHVLQGMLQAMDIIADLKLCKSDMQQVIADLNATAIEIKQKNYKNALKLLGSTLRDIGTAINNCKLEELGNLLIKLASKLGFSQISWIGDWIHIIIHGVDIYDNIYDCAIDWQAKNYLGFGLDLGKLLRLLLF